MTETTAPRGVGGREPTFSVVVPVSNVEAFLPAFLSSLARQSQPLTGCQLIFVNDGSTDSSAELIRQWIAGTDVVAEVVDRPSQGLCAARNAGLERATGTWLTFPDPADALDAHYFARVGAFIHDRSLDVDLVCAHQLMLDHESGTISDAHPLHMAFADGNRVVNLERSPAIVHSSASSGFYRRDRIEQLGLRFDTSIPSSFADGSFTTRYLIATTTPRLGLVADALYLLRKRDGAGSENIWAQEETYTTVLERGYLALLRQVASQRGSVPSWVQNLVLYDLLSYFRIDEATRSATGLARVEWTDRFHELTNEILRHVDMETIDRFAVIPTARHLKEALIIGYKEGHSRPSELWLRGFDTDQRLVQVRYFYAAPAPGETIRIDGRRAIPAYAKSRDITYLNRVLLHERILWLPANAEIAIALEGRRMPIRHDPATSAAPSAKPSLDQQLKSAIRTRFPRAIRSARRLRQAVTRRSPRTAGVAPSAASAGVFADLDPRHDARIVREAGSGPIRRRYEGAWAFMDRDTEAHDNAEHLYRYVRRHHPQVNAWFVLRRESADWDRLAEEGFRLVPFGAAQHVQLLLNTDHLISSQVDHYVVHPLDSARFGRPAWRFTFLQHGITHNDLSRWLNRQPIDRFVTASPAEHESIVGDGSPYIFTEKEVRLTGFPRHDRLLELKRGVDRPNLILVMPTWRRWLLGTATGGNARELKVPLSSTTFGRTWFDFIGSAQLRALGDGADLQVAFVPHPNIEAYIAADDLPGWVSVHGYPSSDVQDLLARAAVTITDYSSLAFEAAYIGCPVVYYQFDRDDFFSGTHAYRKGGWDATTHGFGPVVVDLAGALDAVRDAVGRDEPIEPYRTRMREAFAYRDGRCCERTFESILSLTRPATYQEALRFVPEVGQTGGLTRGQAVDSSPPTSQSRG